MSGCGAALRIGVVSPLPDFKRSNNSVEIIVNYTNSIIDVFEQVTRIITLYAWVSEHYEWSKSTLPYVPMSDIQSLYQVYPLPSVSLVIYPSSSSDFK